jgi:hypothetical protein
MTGAGPYRMRDLLDDYAGEWDIARIPSARVLPENEKLVRCVLRANRRVFVTCSTPAEARDAIELARR